jgi:hypothetical protein
MASTRENVKAAIKAQFLAMAAAGIYTYPPDQVECVLMDDEAYFVPGATATTIYLVRPGKESIALKDTGSSQSTWEITVIAATSYTGSPTKEFPAGETSQQRWEVSNDLVADVVQCVSRDPRFGGVCVGTMEQPFEIQFGYLPEWAIVQVTFTVDYRFATGGR